MWKNRRRTVALLGGAATLLLPFLEIRGRSAVRFDLPTLSLHLFGAVVPIDEFYLVLLGALFLVALTLWVAVVGTRFCKTVCPYAMLQNVLADRETLAVAYDPARAECLRCERCARVCPAGIDIRAGGQRECIACASCIDACREVTSGRNVAPFIAYRGTVLRGKAYLFAGGCLAAALVLLAAIWSRPDVLFAVQWEGMAGTPGEILITASGRGFRIVRKAAFP